MLFKIYAVLSFQLVVFDFSLAINPGASGVCNVTETHTKFETKPETYIEYKKVNFCPGSWFRGQTKCPDKEVKRTHYVEVPKNYVVVKQVCCTGYEKVMSKCQPVCSQTCENSRCIGPENCACNSGYKKFSAYRCVPDCPNCSHGNCLAPGLCVCSSGYVEQAGLGCIPRCEQCNGQCIAPNTCITTTIEVIKTTIATSTTFELTTTDEPELIPPVKVTEIFPEDFYNSNEESAKDERKTFYNEPQETEIPTSTSVLISSSTETPCPLGMVLDSAETCHTQCEIDCHYGFLDENKFCHCQDGFENAPNNPCVCEPFCEHECTHGICTGNNTCLCEEGFKLDPENRFSCLDNNKCHCKNGDYIENRDNADSCSCSCWKGYKLDQFETNYHRCEPICDGCVNGRCVGPFMCLCNQGFIHEAGNNQTCYVNLECEECIEKGLDCLPACYKVKPSTEEVWLIEKTSLGKRNSDVQPILIYLIVIASLIFILALIALVLHKKYNKKFDYDINKREQSSNNVYFSNKNGVQVHI